MKTTITQKHLKELLSYDPQTGIFKWKKTKGSRAQKGNIAGSLINTGYRMVCVDHKSYPAHRLAWLYVHGYFPEHSLDHINRIPTDNRIENLREVSDQCNMRNRKISHNNKSGISGICFCKQNKKWRVSISIYNKTYNLGRYKDFDNAVCARLAAEQCLNWDGCDSNSSAYQYVQRMLA